MPTFGGKKHWLLVIDNSSYFILSFFLKEKSNLVDIMIGLIKILKNKFNLQVKYLCCNNVGENFAFEKAYKEEGLGVDFKYTAPGTPQQNGCIEEKFSTLFNQVHAMLNGGKFNAYLQNDLWAKAVITTMFLKNNVPTPNRTLSPFQQLFGKRKRSILSLMQKFVEMCFTIHRDNTYWAKLANQGTPGFWDGYAEGHPTSIYQAFNPKTKKIILTKDVTFLWKSYFEYRKVKNLSWLL